MHRKCQSIFNLKLKGKRKNWHISVFTRKLNWKFSFFLFYEHFLLMMSKNNASKFKDNIEIKEKLPKSKIFNTKWTATENKLCYSNILIFFLSGSLLLTSKYIQLPILLIMLIFQTQHSIKIKYPENQNEKYV